MVQCIDIELDAVVVNNGHATARKLLKAVEEFHTYIEHNGGFIPNYGERYRHGERISTGFMAWTQCDAHLLLQVRTRVLNGDWEATFRQWYPGFRASPQQVTV